MEQFETSKGEYVISTDKSRLDLNVIHEFLSKLSYWAYGRSEEIVASSIDHSMCFGLYTEAGSQAGFARVVTDLTTFAWICDFFIIESHRGNGLGKWLITTIVEHPDLNMLRRHLLATRDAHGLYREHGGFTPLQNPDHWMERVVELSLPKSSNQGAA